MSKLEIKILTPRETLFEGQVSSLVAPGEDGLFGILPKHSPMIVKLKKGYLKVENQGQAKNIPINEGFLEVKKDVVTVLFA